MTYTLTGRYPLGDLTGRDGEHLRFTPSTTIVGDGNIVLPAPVEVTLSSDGTFSVALVGTDDPAYAPSGWVWVVQELMDGGRPAWAFELTADADMADLTGVAVPPTYSMYDLTVASTTTGDPGTAAVVTISGQPPAQELDFTIPRGASVLNGVVAPTAGDGKDSDFWIDTATSNLYGPKAGGAWPAPVSLVGAPSSLYDAHTILAATVDNTPAPVTVAEQRIVGRKTDGNITALTAAEVLTLTGAAPAASSGNLLTAAAATPTTGAYTLSGCTEAGGLTLTASGSGAYTAAVSGIPVTVGQVYNVTATLAPTGRAVATRISWRNSGGSEISAVAGNSIAAAATGRSDATGVAPAGAVTLIAYFAYASTGTGGDTVTVTKAGAWAGAGGEWAMPGVPITNLGTKTTHPNTDDVLVQRWDEGLGRWQTVHRDTGWRDISASVTAPSGMTLSRLHIRRVGATVQLRFNWVQNATGPAEMYYTCPTGFQFAPGLQDIGGNIFAFGTTTRTGSWYTAGGGTFITFYAASNQTCSGFAIYPCDQAWPTSLPGTLVSAAPA